MVLISCFSVKMPISIMCSLKYKKTCFYIPTLKKNKNVWPMQYKSYGIWDSLSNYNASSQGKCMECFPGLFVPFEIQCEMVSLPTQSYFFCCNYLCVIKVPVHEVHSFLRVYKQVSVYSKICPEQN